MFLVQHMLINRKYLYSYRRTIIIEPRHHGWIEGREQTQLLLWCERRQPYKYRLYQRQSQPSCVFLEYSSQLSLEYKFYRGMRASTKLLLQQQCLGRTAHTGDRTEFLPVVHCESSVFSTVVITGTRLVDAMARAASSRGTNNACFFFTTQACRRGLLSSDSIIIKNMPYPGVNAKNLGGFHSNEELARNYGKPRARRIPWRIKVDPAGAGLDFMASFRCTV